MIKQTIVDGSGTGTSAGVLSGTNGNGLCVYTFEGIIRSSKTMFFSNETNGNNMAIDASGGGTPENIHNGTDSAYWTGSILSGAPGEFVFDSTDQAQSGTKSVDAVLSDNNDQAIFTKSSTIDLADYGTLTGGIYITGWSTGGSDKNVRFYWRNGGTTTGSEVSLSNYIDTTSFNVWQNFQIPLIDFSIGTSTVDEIVMRTVDIGGGAAPNYYIDNLALQELGAGGGIQYEIAPDKKESYMLHNIVYSLADVFAGTEANASMPRLPYDSLLGVSALTNGINIQFIKGGEVFIQHTFNNMLDIIETPEPTQVTSGSDGTNTWLRIDKNYDHNILLEGAKGDKIVIQLDDDLSGLLRFKVAANLSKITYQEHT